jgi:hypothetical protein
MAETVVRGEPADSGARTVTINGGVGARLQNVG